MVEVSPGIWRLNKNSKFITTEIMSDYPMKLEEKKE